MIQQLTRRLVWLQAFVMLLLFGFSGITQAAIPASERQALIDLFNSTNGPSWKDNSGWLGAVGTECDWKGIFCTQKDYVTYIFLYSNQLKGSIPATLGQLSKLEYLTFFNNQLSGAIPDSLGQLSQLSQLKDLDLSFNQLSGTIPATLGQLNQLSSLNLSYNQLSGTIPMTLGQLNQLSSLNLSYTQLSGTIPMTLGQLNQLSSLDLSDNQLSGSLPAILGQLSQLEHLDIQNNQFSGTISSALLNLKSIREIHLDDNHCLTTDDPALVKFLNRYNFGSNAGWTKQGDNCPFPADNTNGRQVSDTRTPTLASASFIEPNNTSQQALPILINDTPVIQTLNSIDTEDWFEFYAKAGQKLTIEIPGSSIGKSINPALQLYDKSGKVLSNLLTRTTVGQSILIQVTVPATDLFRIRITNQAPLPKLAEVDNSYQVRVYLTDEPQQGIIKGFVLDKCAQRGISEAEVSSQYNNQVNATTLTYSTGEFGLPLNPNNYNLKSHATTFEDQSLGPVTVKINDIARVQLDQNPTGGCANYKVPDLDPVIQEQQAVAVYDDKTGGLIVRDLMVDGCRLLCGYFTNIGNYRFQLSRARSIPGTIHTVPGEYDGGSLVVKLPAVFAFGKTWKLQMKNDSNWVFSVIQADPK